MENIDVNFLDDDGFSALLLGVWNNHVEVVEALKMVKNVDWNVQSYKGKVMSGGWNMIAESTGWSPATLALKRRNVEVLKAILSVPGLDLNLKTHKGSTVASIAVAQGGALITDDNILIEESEHIRNKKEILNDLEGKYFQKKVKSY